MLNLFVEIVTWIKNHIVLFVIIGIVVVGAVATPIIINNKNDNSNQSLNNKSEKKKIIWSCSKDKNFNTYFVFNSENLIKEIIFSWNETFDSVKEAEQNYDKYKNEMSSGKHEYVKLEIDIEGSIIDLEYTVDYELIRKDLASDKIGLDYFDDEERQHDIYDGILTMLYNTKEDMLKTTTAVGIKCKETTRQNIDNNKKIITGTNGYYIYESNETSAYIQLKSNGEFYNGYALCGGSLSCGMYGYIGTYTINNNVINVVITHEGDIDYKKSDEIKNKTYTIISKTQIKDNDNNEYTYQKSY